MDEPDLSDMLDAKSAGAEAAVVSLRGEGCSNPYDKIKEAHLYWAWQAAFDEAMDAGSEMIHLSI